MDVNVTEEPCITQEHMDGFLEVGEKEYANLKGNKFLFGDADEDNDDDEDWDPDEGYDAELEAEECNEDSDKYSDDDFEVDIHLDDLNDCPTDKRNDAKNGGNGKQSVNDKKTSTDYETENDNNDGVVPRRANGLRVVGGADTEPMHDADSECEASDELRSLPSYSTDEENDNANQWCQFNEKTFIGSPFRDWDGVCHAK